MEPAVGAIHTPEFRFLEIIKGKRGTTADFACRLEAALGTPSYMWIGWQAEFEFADSTEQFVEYFTVRRNP